jgi:hypothetical protein
MVLAGAWGLALGAAMARDVSVAAHGTRGDGVTDDGPAIQRALTEATHHGGDTRLVFEKKTYRIGRLPNGTLLDLRELHDFSVAGNGAVFLNSPHNALVNISRCTNVSVGGFTLESDPLSFSQGTVTAVNAKEGWFEVRVHAGYLNWEEELRAKRIAGVSIGMLMQAERPLRKQTPNSGDFIEVERSQTTTPGLVRVTPGERHRKQLQDLAAGDRFVITFYHGGHGANFSVSGSSHCTYHDITVYSAKFGMTFSVTKNLDQVTLRRIVIQRKPGTDRLLATPKDGMHCKENRVGPLIEDCHFEGLLDDSINISVCPYWVKGIVNEKTILAHAGPPLVGDRLQAYNPSRERLGYYRVMAVEPYHPPGKRVVWQRITLDQPVVDFDLQPSDNDFPGGPEKLKCTGLYNLDACGSGYVVRNCTFREQRRFAILARPSGTIEGNLMDSTGGSAMHLGNEIGSFYEGPIPQQVVIRNNTIRNVLSDAIVFYSRTKLHDPLAHTVLVESNRIETLHGSALRASCASNIMVRGNTIVVNERAVPETGAIRLDHCRDVELSRNQVTDPRPGVAAVSGRDTYAREVRLAANTFTLARESAPVRLEADPPEGLLMPRKPRYLAVAVSGQQEIPLDRSPYTQVFNFHGGVERGKQTLPAYEVHPPFGGKVTSSSIFFGDQFEVKPGGTLSFAAAKMNPKGDGVIVKLAVRTGTGKSEGWQEVFSKKITSESWQNFEVSLAAWQGKTMHYRFEVNSGSNTAFDNTSIGGIRLKP